MKFLGKPATLWLCLAPVCAALWVSTTTISPHDFWWHAAAGRLIAETGNIPTTNHFSWAMPADAPYVYQNWLAQWMIYQVLRIGGISAISIWRSASIGFALAIVGAAAMRRARRTLGENADETAIVRGITLASLLSLAMILMNLDARPQTFALPFFAAVVFIIMEWPYRGARFHFAAGAGLVVLTALWANFHGSFFLVPLALGVLFFGEELGAGLGFFAPIQKTVRRALAIAFVACLAAVALNPLGFEIFFYVTRLSTNVTIQKLIVEWQAPSPREGSGLAFFIAPLLLILAARIARRKSAIPLRGGETLLLLLLFAMGARNMRSILWFALFFTPVFAVCLAGAFAKSTPEKRRTFPRSAQVFNAILLCFLIFSVVLFSPRLKNFIAWPASFRARFAPTPRGEFPQGFSNDPQLLLDRETPVEAAEFLRANPPRKLWNDMGYGSYLMWALPDVKLGADPRIELYSENYWRDYLSISAGAPDALRRLDEMQISDALCDRQQQAGLLKRLRASRRWREIILPRGAARDADLSANRSAVLMRRKL